MNEEIQANSKELLGGDIQVSSGIEPLSDKTLEKLSQLGQISEMIELGTMLAKQKETPVFTQLRAVDSQYPLYGVMQTIPKDAAQQLFLSESIPIVLINENIQNQLQLDIGDDVTIMGQNFIVGGLISSVPDIAQSAVFGEFAIINKQQFDKFNLKTSGSFLDHDYRLKIAPDKTSEGIINQIEMLFANNKIIETRLPKDSGQGLRSAIDNFSNFLNLVAVSALIIAGIGISNTLLSFVNQRNISIAVKKSLGFSSKVIQLIYFYEIILIPVSYTHLTLPTNREV